MNTITNETEFFEQIMTALRTAESICLTTHINPDGDGLGTCLALKRILNNFGYKADVVTDADNFAKYDFLNIKAESVQYNEEMRYDLVLVIDLHDNRRLGNRISLLEKADRVFVIDHHEIEDDLMKCTIAWVDSFAVCTGWMIYKLFGHEIDGFSDEDKIYVGKCLYATLLNDTNNFTNANTDANAFELAKIVTEYGINPSGLHKQFFTNRTAAEMRLLGQTLATIELRGNNKILFIDSTMEMLMENELESEATSNLTCVVQDLKGIDTAVYFREENHKSYRLSLRSTRIDVHSIAVKYNGGGHLRASGCTLQGSLEEVKSLILDEINNAPLL